jgi:hypothetical protein
MAQPTKTNNKVVFVKKKKVKTTDKRLPPKPKNTPLRRSQRPHKEYGVSKLELRFAREFLDKLGIDRKSNYSGSSNYNSSNNFLNNAQGSASKSTSIDDIEDYLMS